jgi:hypothetical protein
MTRAALAFVLCLLLFSGQAYAFDTPLTDTAERSGMEASAKVHQHYADELGCDKFVWGTRNTAKAGATYTLKYLPEGVEMAAWEKMVLVTVYNLPGDATAARTYMAKAIAGMEGQYRKFATISKDVTTINAKDEPILVLEYSMGEGDAKDYTAAKFMRTGSDTAAFIRFESRRKPVPAEVSTQIREKLLPDAK